MFEPRRSAGSSSEGKVRGSAKCQGSGSRFGLDLDDREGVAEFEDLFHQDFDVVNPGAFEFELAEKGNVSGVVIGFLEGEFHIALPEDGGLVGGHDADAFGELSDTGGPAVKDAELEGGDGKLGNMDEADDSEEDEIAIDFLPHFFAEKGALQVGHDPGWLHNEG
jgi:hypothetical protein